MSGNEKIGKGNNLKNIEILKTTLLDNSGVSASLLDFDGKDKNFAILRGIEAGNNINIQVQNVWSGSNERKKIVISATSGGGGFGTLTPLALGTANTGTANFASREDHVHPMPNLDDINDVNTTSAVEGNLLIRSASSWFSGDIMLPNNYNFWVCENNGDDGTGNGSINRPFKTIQRAINQYTGTGGCVIHIMGGIYNENLNINKNDVALVGYANINSSNRVEVVGGSVLTSGIGGLKAKNIAFRSAIAGIPCMLFNSAAGNVYFENCSLSHDVLPVHYAVAWFSLLSNDFHFNNCWISGTCFIGGGSSTNGRVQFLNCDFRDVSVVRALGTTWQVTLDGCVGIDRIEHNGGRLYIFNTKEFGGPSTTGLLSAAGVDPQNILVIGNTSFLTKNNVMKTINKSGSCDYIIWNTLRSVSSDNLVGSRIRLGSESVDFTHNIVNVSATNYNASYNNDIIVMNNFFARTVNLPPGLTGKRFIIKDGVGTASSNNITVNAASGQSIQGSLSFVMNINYQSITLIWNGTMWLLM